MLHSLLKAVAILTFVASIPTLRASTLLVGESLEYGQSLTSENGRYRFLVQTDGNLVVYDDNGVPYWASQTAR